MFQFADGVVDYVTLPINSAPLAVDVDLGSTNEDVAIVLTEAAILANSSDIDGDTLSITALSVDPAYGAIVDNGDSTWTYTPVVDWNGNDVALSFTVSDGSLTSNATATIDVAAINDAPSVVNVDLGSTDEDTSVIITEAALLANSSDVDGDTLSITALSVSPVGIGCIHITSPEN